MSTATVEKNVCFKSGHKIQAVDVLVDPIMFDPVSKQQVRKSIVICTQCGRTHEEIRKARAPRSETKNEEKEPNVQNP